MYENFMLYGKHEPLNSLDMSESEDKKSRLFPVMMTAITVWRAL